MSKVGLNGKEPGRAGPPPKHKQLQNRLTRAAKRSAELRLDMFEEQNDKVMAAFKILMDYPLGKCPPTITKDHYKAAKDLYEEWCKSCDRAESHLDFLEKRDDSGESPKDTPAVVKALFSPKPVD